MKNEKQAALSGYFLRLSQSLPLADFYKDVFPTIDMKRTVASMYIEIIALIEQATKYYCLGSLGNLSELRYCWQSRLTRLQRSLWMLWSCLSNTILTNTSIT
jgi:hypothetical protein